MTLENLLSVKKELQRFSDKLDDAIIRFKSESSVEYIGCKESGAVKRAALDLKIELTKITK